MGLEWADEQTLRWPIQDLQPWANRAASDGPMKGQCIRAIWVLASFMLSAVITKILMSCECKKITSTTTVVLSMLNLTKMRYYAQNILNPPACFNIIKRNGNRLLKLLACYECAHFILFSFSCATANNINIKEICCA